MPVIGLTGSIASGKSLVTEILKDLGAQVVDADVVAREAVEPGSEGWRQVVAAFGEGVLKRDGTINRKLLGERVFKDPGLRTKLNNITHPIIIKEIRERIDRFRKHDAGLRRVLVLDAPLLLETGLDNLVDEVWVVDVPEETQVERLMERDGLSREQALRRIASQMGSAEKKKHADVVIDNSGDSAATRKQVMGLWEQRFGSGVETGDI